MAELTEIDAENPERLFVELAKNMAPAIRKPFNEDDRIAIISYYKKLRHAANGLGIQFDISPVPQLDPGNSDLHSFFDRLLDEIEIRKIDVLISNLREKSVDQIKLDSPWREKIHSYVAYIRQIVMNVDDLSIEIRESLLKKLHGFDAEVDKGRTNLQAFTDIFVSLCEGISRGAQALTPAVKLGEKVIGALARLQSQTPTLALPPPEQFDLQAPESIDQDSNNLS